MSNKSGKMMSRLFEVLYNLKTRLWNLPVSGRILNYDNFAFKQLLHDEPILNLLRDYESVDEPWTHKLTCLAGITLANILFRIAAIAAVLKNIF